MPRNKYIGWNQQDLEAALRRAQEDSAEGKTIIENRSGDVSKREQVESSASQRIKELSYALHLLDPVTYPADQIAPSNRTKATFDRPAYYGY